MYSTVRKTLLTSTATRVNSTMYVRSQGKRGKLRCGVRQKIMKKTQRRHLRVRAANMPNVNGAALTVRIKNHMAAVDHAHTEKHALRANGY